MLALVRLSNLLHVVLRADAGIPSSSLTKSTYAPPHANSKRPRRAWCSSPSGSPI
jgi:hypothetical protein